MLVFAGKRVVRALLVILFATFLVVALLSIAPGSLAVTLLGDAATPEAVAELEARLGLDKPLWSQYLGWLGRLRPVPAAVLATALLAVGVATGLLLSGGGDDAQTVPGFGPRGAQVALRVQGSHGQLDLHGMPKAPGGRVYQVWLVTGKDKPRATHALFSVRRDGRASVDIPESLKGTDQVLVTAEPPGGSEQPTSTPVAGAKLT